MENFCEKVYHAVKLIPFGKVTSYGEIAKFLGMPKHARQVGWALHRNPYPIEVPCHRVVFSNGALSSAFAFGGEKSQKQILEQENVTFKKDKVDLQKHLYKFKDN